MGFSEDFILRRPYDDKNKVAIIDIHIAISSISERKAPTPNTPAPINNASETAHTRQEIKTCDFINPCLNTKTFCGPSANIREILIANPSSQIDSNAKSRRPSFNCFRSELGI